MCITCDKNQEEHERNILAETKERARRWAKANGHTKIVIYKTVNSYGFDFFGSERIGNKAIVEHLLVL